MEHARFTFQCMRSYALFRIAEAIRIILFMTLSSIAFIFYPITALMILLLSLLNDLPILAIAYSAPCSAKKWPPSMDIRIVITGPNSRMYSRVLTTPAWPHPIRTIMPSVLVSTLSA